MPKYRCRECGCATYIAGDVVKRRCIRCGCFAMVDEKRMLIEAL
jgi:hypothetical protein